MADMLKPESMPFEGKRMIYGGFEMIVDLQAVLAADNNKLVEAIEAFINAMPSRKPDLAMPLNASDTPSMNSGKTGVALTPRAIQMNRAIWTAPTLADKYRPHIEARSNARD